MQKIIIKEIKHILGNPQIEINGKTPLIGGASALNSLGLVSLCLKLEEIAEEQGFEFDWTSEKAMSVSQGFFKSVDALAEEFVRQRGSA